jgi:hypothetical protein
MSLLLGNKPVNSDKYTKCGREAIYYSVVDNRDDEVGWYPTE